MKKNKFLCFFTAFSVLLALFGSFSLSALAADPGEVNANAVYLVETTSETVLYEKNADQQVAPASTTKVMTVLLTLQAIEQGRAHTNDIVTVPEDAYFDIPADGSTAGLQAGYEVTLEELLYCALLPSANEACNTIARYLSGSVEGFVTRMNEMAQELGCTGTHFANTHGLSQDDHYVTAHDLYLIYQAALQYPLFTEISSSTQYTIAANETHPAIQLENTNQLLDEDGKYYYEDCTAGKTGYTGAAGYCLVSSAVNEDKGMSLIAVVMGTESVTDTDGSTLIYSFAVSRQLYDWAFANFSFRSILTTNDLLAEAAVTMGAGADSVVLRPSADVTVLLDDAVTDDMLTYDIHVYEETVQAPVASGDVLGDVSVSYHGEVLGTAKLVANTSVALSKGQYIKSELNQMTSSTVFKVILLLVLLMFILYIVFVIRYNRIRKERHRRAVEKAREEAMYRRQAAETTTQKSFEEIEEMLSNEENAAKK